VAVLTQTTLSQDDAAEIVAAIRSRFPAAVTPPVADICYATQNRQAAAVRLAARVDLVLVLGAATSANTCRLVEVVRRHGRRSLLIRDASALGDPLVAAAARIGITAGASTPETFVQEIVAALRQDGPCTVSEWSAIEEIPPW
jgi:4-hydroxy-3-methylbut-2-enyl diphosphate reductase